MAHYNVSLSPILTDNASVDDKGPGGVLDQLPSLKESADLARTTILGFNEYKNIDNGGYSPQHSNAQSDGDDHGRGETGANKGVGTSIDKKKKGELIYGNGIGLSNKYKPGKGYPANGKQYSEEYW